MLFLLYKVGDNTPTLFFCGAEKGENNTFCEIWEKRLKNAKNYLE